MKNSIAIRDNINQGIEFGRVLAATSVIYIHFSTHPSPLLHSSVTYFFMASGFLLAKHIENDSQNHQTAKSFTLKHFHIFFLWAFFYSLLPSNWPTALLHGYIGSEVLNTANLSINKLALNPLNWFLDGPPNGFHLWYLTNAPFALILLIICLRLNFKWASAVISFLCLLIIYFLTEKECAGTILWSTKAKVGILIAIPSLIAGYYLKINSIKKSNLYFAYFLIILSFLIESLSPEANSCPSIQSITLGVGAFIFLASFKTIYLGSIWSTLGKLTLNVYLVHLAFRPAYYMVSGKLNNVPENILILGFVFFIFMFSYAVSAFQAINWHNK